MHISASPTSASSYRFKIFGGISWSIARKQVQLSRPKILLRNAWRLATRPSNDTQGCPILQRSLRKGRGFDFRSLHPDSDPDRRRKSVSSSRSCSPLSLPPKL